jgi:hypothetical protein
MRILVFTLILISFFKLPARAQGVDHGVREKVLAAKAEAIRVIQTYSHYHKNDRQESEMTKAMADLLEESSTAQAVGQTLRYCNTNPNVVADTDWISQVVAICPYGLTLSKDNLIQTFIHEAYHLYEGKYYMPKYYPDIYKKILSNPQFEVGPHIRDESEKRAATIELKIMKETYGCVFSVTSYFDDLLGLVRNKDYFICK